MCRPACGAAVMLNWIRWCTSAADGVHPDDLFYWRHIITLHTDWHILLYTPTDRYCFTHRLIDIASHRDWHILLYTLTDRYCFTRRPYTNKDWLIPRDVAYITLHWISVIIIVCDLVIVSNIYNSFSFLPFLFRIFSYICAKRLLFDIFSATLFN